MSAAEDRKDAIRKALSGASSIRLEGELVHREQGGIAVRRGRSVFEVQAADIIEIREMEGNKVLALVKADGQLIRSTVINNKWVGGTIGWRPSFDDCSECTDCTECSVCADCTECSVCTDCTECSVCTDCTECSVCADCTECSVCTDCTECSVCTGTECSVCLGGWGGLSGAGTLSAWIRRRLIGGRHSGGFVRMTRVRQRFR